MRPCQFIEKFVAFFVVWAIFFPSYVALSTDSVQAAENQKYLYVFFVQNKGYDGNKNLTGSVNYVDSVDSLLAVLEKYANAYSIKACWDTYDVKAAFSDWLESLPSDRFSSSTTFLIVLNGHGAQLGVDGKYVFKNVDYVTNETSSSSRSTSQTRLARSSVSSSARVSSYEPLEGFLDAYKNRVKPAGTVPDKQKAKFVFWVLTCRTTMTGTEAGNVPNYDDKIKLEDYKCDVLYACESDGQVDVGANVKSFPILDALKEGVEGAADAEGDYDGYVDFEEIHQYAKTENDLRMDNLKSGRKSDKIVLSYVETYRSYGNNVKDPPSKDILSSIDRAFYSKELDDDYFQADRHEELFEGRACSVEEYPDVPFPFDLPDKYRYDYRFKKFDFKSGNYWGAYFRGLDLSYAKFSSGKLNGACFDHCNLTGATCGGESMTSVSTQEKEGFTVE